MKTWFDIIKEPVFRQFITKRLTDQDGVGQYMMPNVSPTLYRYRSLSEYSVDEVVNGTLTLSSISEFNDIFDGAIHSYSNSEIKSIAEEQWKSFEEYFKHSGLPSEALLSHPQFVESKERALRIRQRNNFDLLSYLGAYAACFSEDNTSILMWAHYARNNSGICLEYDFNQLDNDNFLRLSLFPVKYLNTPINVLDLLTDEKRTLCNYPEEAAVLCAALSKASVWEYEHEWRMFFVSLGSFNKLQRVALTRCLSPKAVYFGYHFLRPFFYYDSKDSAQRKKCIRNIENAKRLINHMNENGIHAAVMWPDIGSYNFVPKPVDTDKLLNFIISNFDEAIDIVYYNTIHKRLYELVFNYYLY